MLDAIASHEIYPLPLVSSDLRVRGPDAGIPVRSTECHPARRRASSKLRESMSGGLVYPLSSASCQEFVT
jgi:hypothetical protein